MDYGLDFAALDTLDAIFGGVSQSFDAFGPLAAFALAIPFAFFILYAIVGWFGFETSGFDDELERFEHLSAQFDATADELESGYSALIAAGKSNAARSGHPYYSYDDF